MSISSAPPHARPKSFTWTRFCPRYSATLNTCTSNFTATPVSSIFYTATGPRRFAQRTPCAPATGAPNCSHFSPDQLPAPWSAITTAWQTARKSARPAQNPNRFHCPAAYTGPPDLDRTTSRRQDTFQDQSKLHFIRNRAARGATVRRNRRNTPRVKPFGRPKDHGWASLAWY